MRSDGRMGGISGVALIIPLFLLVIGLPSARGAEQHEKPTSTGPRPAPDVVTRMSEQPLSISDLPPKKRFVTTHATRILDQDIGYTAIAGETYITNLYGEPTASIFSFSYLVNAPAKKDRPVIFVFNGGPGSSSIWLHMGIVGPRRVVLDREVNPGNLPPFRYQDNPFSLLDVADLVFVDPIGTGYSQAVGNARNSDFYGVEEDADANARFIEAWLTEHGRWNSPKYLMGESYGGTRVAVMSRALAGGPFYGGTLRGITVDGIIMVSPTLAPKPRAATTNLDMELALPTFAVTSWYHRRVPRDDRTAMQIYAEAKDYAIAEYRTALDLLDKGKLDHHKKAKVAVDLAALSGVSAEEWTRRGLKMSSSEFRRLLLRDQGLETGAYDGRYTMPLDGSGDDPVADDPAMAKYTPAFIGAFHQMIGSELQVSMSKPYNAITWAGANFDWNWNRPAGGSAATPGGDLSMAMRRTGKMRLLVASGLYDFATTPASAEHEIRSANLPEDRLIIRTYESGHMLYIGETAEAFAEDVRALITNTLAQSSR